MANNLTIISDEDKKLIPVMASSLYPGAQPESIALVIAYCRAAQLDPLQKPVHIVPMWSRDEGRMKDVIMPGISLYRTMASRSGSYAGCSEPEFGPDVTEKIDGVTVTYPAWCRVTVRRIVGGQVAEFTAKELWKENYAIKGGKEKSRAPNAMWERRTYGQLAKVAEAQALRRAFPEFCSAYTADEMEGKPIDARDMGAAEVVSATESLKDRLRAKQDAAAEAPQPEAPDDVPPVDNAVDNTVNAVDKPTPAKAPVRLFTITEIRNQYAACQSAPDVNTVTDGIRDKIADADKEAATNIRADRIEALRKAIG